MKSSLPLNTWTKNSLCPQLLSQAGLPYLTYPLLSLSLLGQLLLGLPLDRHLLGLPLDLLLLAPPLLRRWPGGAAGTLKQD